MYRVKIPSSWHSDHLAEVCIMRHWDMQDKGFRSPPEFCLFWIAGKMPVLALLKLSNICRISTWMGDHLGIPQRWLSINSFKNCAGAFLELVSALAKATPLVSDRIVENVSSLSICVIFTGWNSLPLTQCSLSGGLHKDAHQDILGRIYELLTTLSYY